jgi:SM-20-related protein
VFREAMDEHDIFTRLGLYLERGFLDAPVCDDICSRMESHPYEAAAVKSLATGDYVDETVRRTCVAQVPIDYAYTVRDRLDQSKSALEAHFKLSLKLQEKPQFLLYEPGGYYAMHRDVPSEQVDSDARIKGRVVSIIVFLNDRTGPSPYSGGELIFYGLSPDPQWKNYGLPLDPETGLLVAFRSETLHEVRPVRDGRRYTVATWFH